MNEIKKELYDILGTYMDTILYTDILIGFCKYHFEEKYITSILASLTKIQELNNENCSKMDITIMKIED